MVLTLVVVLILLFAFKTNQKYEILETICSLEVLRSSSFHPGPPTSEQPRILKSTSGPPTRTRGTSQFALPQASASNNLATRNLTVRQRCEADSYLRMTDCITQSLRQPHFWQTKPNCPTAPDCGQLSRIVSLQYTKGWPATSAEVAGKVFVYCKLKILSNCPARGPVGQLGLVCTKCCSQSLCVRQSVSLR